MRIAHVGTALIAMALAVGLSGCPKPPNQALSEAEDAVAQAREKSECAEEKFRAAERLLDEANQLKEQKEYKNAERKAKAAKKLAREAREKAERNWEECQKRLAEQARDSEGEEKAEGDTGEKSSQRTGERLTLETVYFGYDSTELTEDARERLDQNVEWLESNRKRDVVLEGHTDSRGSIEYNLALGEQRAKSVRQYLTQMGISKERLKVLSYGEEKPAAYGDTEEAHQKNRRVEFVPE